MDSMAIVKVTRRRQVTIPKEIGDKLGIKEGDYVRIRLEGEKSVLEKVLGLEDLSGVLNPGSPVRELAEELDRERKRSDRP